MANFISKMSQETDNEVCSDECSSAGCWGKGPDQCLECKNFEFKGRCLASCKNEGQNNSK